MFDYQPQLSGSLVTLRPLVAADREPLYAVASDPLIWELHPQRDRWQPQVFGTFFDEALASGGALTVIDRDSGAIIGSSRYSAQFTPPGEIEIGWTFLARSHWGGRYNLEMKQLMLRHAFRFVDTVSFRIGEHNLRSRRAVEKLGATLTDRVQLSVFRGSEVRHVCYAMTRQGFAVA